MEQKQNRYIPLLLACCTAIGLIAGMQLPRYDKHLTVYANRPGSGGSLLNEVLGYLDTKYVDTVDSLGFDEDLVRNLLDRLDPHTTYLSADALKQADDEMQGSFQGIGIEFLIENDTLRVVSPMAGGPAEAAGIWAGDQFISVNDSTIAGRKISDNALFKLLRGEEGSTVNISVKRGLEPQLRQFTVTRAKIPVHSVTASYLIDEQTAYIKLAKFNHNTHQEFVEAMLALGKNKEKKLDLVLDLRGNPGGLLDQAVKLLSDFFPEGKLLVYTEGRNEKKRTYKSSGRIAVQIDRLVVLMDGGSASASEVVAGAIQDHDRGWVVGERSFGKGLVQEQFPLSNGGALRMTVSRYYTPSGRCIQKDFKNKELYSTEHMHRTDSIAISDSATVYYTGIGRKMYGCMGIIPDAVVHSNPVSKSVSFGRLKSVMHSFIAHSMKNNDKQTYPKTAAEFKQTFNGTELWPEFMRYAETQGIHISKTDWEAMKPYATQELSAALAKHLYDTNAYHFIRNANDPMVLEAMKRLSQPLK